MTGVYWELMVADLETFKALDGPTQSLILRLLEDEPTDAAFVELSRHTNGAMLANWLLTLPAYRAVGE